MEITRPNKVTFTWSCAGSNAFRHSLNIPTGPGSVLQVQNRILKGDGYLHTIAANTGTWFANTAAGTFELVMPDGVVYGDYPSA